MTMVLGFLMTGLGLGGGLGIWSAVSKAGWSAIPARTRQNLTIALLLCVALFVVGVTILIAGVVKKRNGDDLTRIEGMESGGHRKGVCPECGLNLSDEAKRCPQCGAEIKKEGS